MFDGETVRLIDPQQVSGVVQRTHVLLHLGTKVEDGGRKVDGVLRTRHSHDDNDVLQLDAVRANL